MKSPYGFTDHWGRIEPTLTDTPQTTKEIQKLCGLGILTTQLALRMAAQSGLLCTLTTSTRKQRGRSAWSKVLYFRKSVYNDSSQQFKGDGNPQNIQTADAQ